MARFETKFAIGDHVSIDGDDTLRAIVTAVQFRGTHRPSMLEVSWVANGDAKTAWVEDYRLESGRDPRTGSWKPNLLHDATMHSLGRDP